MKIYIKSAVALFAMILPSMAEIKMPTFFSDGMVLQQETGAKIWGTGDVGASIQVGFAGKKLVSRAGDDGKWVVNFQNLKMSKSGATMTVSSREDKREIKNVVVREVWIASGQSNMEWPMSKTTSAEDAKTAEDDLLRVYFTENATAATPVEDFKGSWKKTHPDNNANFTAVGYEFAKNLKRHLDVPVGIIECSWSGKPVESFIREEAIKVLPEAKKIIDRKVEALKKWHASDEKKGKILWCILRFTLIFITG